MNIVEEALEILTDFESEEEKECTMKMMQIALYSKEAEECMENMTEDEHNELSYQEMLKKVQEAFEDEYTVSSFERLEYPVDRKLVEKLDKKLNQLPGTKKNAVEDFMKLMILGSGSEHFNHRAQILLNFLNENSEIELCNLVLLYYAMYVEEKFNFEPEFFKN